MHMIHVTAFLPGGVALPYVESGRSDGVPVVLLHGFSDHWRSYEPVLPHLPAGLRAFAVTQRGHGGASWPQGAYAVTDLAADAAAFLDAVGVERAVLVGHSMGSAVALQAALDAPERVSGLVLGPGFSALRSEAAFGELVAAVHALTEPVDRAFVEAMQEQAHEEHLPPGLFEAMVEQSMRVPARTWHALIDALDEFDLDHELSGVTAPALLIWGDEDPIVGGATQQKLLRDLPDAELLVYPGGGHVPHWDDPRRFAADVSQFALRIGRDARVR
jgi:non-heme chloroperoxidase